MKSMDAQEGNTVPLSKQFFVIRPENEDERSSYCFKVLKYLEDDFNRQLEHYNEQSRLRQNKIEMDLENSFFDEDHDDEKEEDDDRKTEEELPRNPKDGHFYFN